MDSDSANALTRRAFAVLTDPRALRAGASIFYPGLWSLIVGMSGTIVNVGLTALALWPVRHTYTPVYLVSIILVFAVGLPILYFILGARYGVARAALTVYEIARPAVIDLVVEHVRTQHAPPSPADVPRTQKLPRPVRWLIKAILTIGGAGDRLTDAVAEIDQQQRPATTLVGAIVDDLVADHLVAPARNVILLVALVNVVLLVAMLVQT